VGGEESLREFTALARERGWHIGTFCNGTRWVTGHFWSGYDGEDYYLEHGGPSSICRTHEGEPWRENWDAVWRPSYAGCVGAPLTRELAVDFVKQVVGMGLDWVQFFDQNTGCSTFPCFAAGHEHPPVPGRWMTDHMRGLVETLRDTAAATAGPERPIVLSVEGPVNEYYIPYFQICDVRVLPPAHEPNHPMWKGSVPLYHFLYHELLLIQGGFGQGADPHHLAIRNAFNLVVGEIPGAVLKGDGQLLNVGRTDINWAPWEPAVGDNEESLAMLAAATALRRGPAKDFLVYGRMQRPAALEGVRTMRWQFERRDHQVPAVFHAAWQAPDGRLGLAFANWTTEPQTLTVVDSRLGERAVLHVAGPETTARAVDAGRVAIALPALSCALLEAK
jgi:hypothetical protein